MLPDPTEGDDHRDAHGQGTHGQGRATSVSQQGRPRESLLQSGRQHERGATDPGQQGQGQGHGQGHHEQHAVDKEGPREGRLPRGTGPGPVWSGGFGGGPFGRVAADRRRPAAAAEFRVHSAGPASGGGERGGLSSMAEHRIVAPKVAGSSPVGHPNTTHESPAWTGRPHASIEVGLPACAAPAGRAIHAPRRRPEVTRGGDAPSSRPGPRARAAAGSRGRADDVAPEDPSGAVLMGAGEPACGW